MLEWIPSPRLKHKTPGATEVPGILIQDAIWQMAAGEEFSLSLREMAAFSPPHPMSRVVLGMGTEQVPAPEGAPVTPHQPAALVPGSETPNQCEPSPVYPHYPAPCFVDQPENWALTGGWGSRSQRCCLSSGLLMPITS